MKLMMILGFSSRSRSERGPHRARQVPRGLQRVHERGDAFSVHVRGRERRGAHAAARTPGQLHDPAERDELHSAGARRTRAASSDLRTARGADPRRDACARARLGAGV